MHNLSLASQQLNLLIVGAMLFLGGIVLFAVVRLRQTREDEALDLESRKAQTAKVRESATSAISTAREALTAVAMRTEAIASSGRTKARAVLLVAYALWVIAALFALMGGVMVFLMTQHDDIGFSVLIAPLVVVALCLAASWKLVKMARGR